MQHQDFFDSLVCNVNSRWAAWRGGKDNPHRHGAHRYKPMGVTETQRGEPYAHPIGLPLRPDAKKKSGSRSSERCLKNE